MKRVVRIALAITTLGVAGVLGVGSLSSAAGGQELCEAFGAPYCPPPGGTASDTTVVPGQTITIRGEGFTPGETVVVTFNSIPVPMGSFTADADGVVEVEVTIPTDAEPGAHTITMVGQTSGVEVVIPIEVVGTAATGGGGGLARTGSDTGPLVGIGLGLVAAGGAAAYAARRRAETAHPASPV